MTRASHIGEHYKQELATFASRSGDPRTLWHVTVH